MSFAKKSSLTKNNDKNNDDLLNSSSKILLMNKPSKEFLSEDVVKTLLNFGYTLDQIMTAFKIYKFTTVDDAIHILTKDPETGKCNHRFIPFQQRNGEGYDAVVASNSCMICSESINDHIDYELNKTSIEDISIKEILKTVNYDIKDTTTLDLTNLKTTLNNIKNDTSNFNTEKKILEIPNIEIPKETLDLFEDPEICRICFSVVLNETNKAYFDCGHSFCNTCVINHLTTNITNGRVLMIKCLYGGCAKTFIDDEIRSYVDPNIYGKYRKFKLSQLRMNNPGRNFINCPTPDCDEMIDISDIDSNNTKLSCQLDHKFCARCMMPGWHENGSKCKNYGDELLNSIKKNTDALNYKQCPQCSVIIEKNEGCNQMKCLACNFEFCWLCLKKYSHNHYAMYNFTGCPGMRFNTPVKKKWNNNIFLKSLWYFLSFLLGILVICLIIFFFLLFGCPYEFVKCCFKKKNESDENNIDPEIYGNSFQNSLQRNPGNMNLSAINSQQESEINNESNLIVEHNWWGYTKLGLIIFLGILCQPFYLLFYVLYFLMQCYRKFSCWFYYVDY